MRARVVPNLVLLSVLLSACALGPKATPTSVPRATPVPSPTAIPTPSQPLAVLVLPADMDKDASDAYQKTVYDLTQQSNMRFQVRNTLAPGDIEPGLKVVIALPPDPGIAALAAAAPTVQFLAVDIPGVAAGGNVSVLASSAQVDIPAFAAGYAAGMISDDYRAGMILPKNDANAQRAAQAFSNGMAYYCGLCTSFKVYFDQNGGALTFPQFIQIATDQDPNQWGINYLIGYLKLDAVYLYPDPKLETSQVYSALGQSGAQFIGIDAPNPKPAGWGMEIRADAVKAIQKAWPNLVAGQGGQSIASPFGLADVDPAVLSPGKQRLVEQVLDGLQSGRIATGVSQ